MKILQINITYRAGSTGKIMYDLNNTIRKNGHQCYMISGYTNESSESLYCMHPQNFDLSVKKDLLVSRITGRMGYRQNTKTKKMLQWVDSIKPDIIHMHNIHGDWLNIPLLMEYIKKKKIPVVWTLHDCWGFTGRCSYFESFGCDKWKTGCYRCKNNRVYPITYFFDHSERMWKDKIKWFSDLDNAIIVTPSQWLSGYVEDSFLNQYPIKVINNGIDLSVFKPQVKKSKYLFSLDKKKKVLGVASSWTKRKGLEDIYELKKILNDDTYQIVIVGLNEKQIKSVPDGIVAIRRTNNVQELTELYTEASVLINPTYQDNYPTVNLEAIACGTPVITYHTGGSIESVNEDVGQIVEQGDIAGLKKSVEDICKNERYNSQKCKTYAEKNFDKTEKYMEYLAIYDTIIKTPKHV